LGVKLGKDIQLRLTALQRDANRFLEFTAQQTLDYTQSLYLLEGNGVITIDDRIATILSGIKSNYVKEIALKQIQVLIEIETDHSNK
jgi:hypothetical protein